MRYLAGLLFGVLGALAPASFAAYDFSFSPPPGTFTYSRAATDDGVIIDHLRAALPIPSTPVEANTYSVHVAFPSGTWINFSPQINRIDLLASLGDLQTTFGVHNSTGSNKASAGCAVQNLS